MKNLAMLFALAFLASACRHGSPVSTVVVVVTTTVVKGKKANDNLPEPYWPEGLPSLKNLMEGEKIEEPVAP